MALFCDEYNVSDEQRYKLPMEKALELLDDRFYPKLSEVVGARCHGFFDHEAYFANKESIPDLRKIYEYIIGVFKEELGPEVKVVGAYRDVRETKKGWKSSVRAWLPTYAGDVKAWRSFAKRLNEKYDMQELYNCKKVLFDLQIYHENRKLNCIGKYKSDNGEDKHYILKPFNPDEPLQNYIVGYIRGDESEMLPVIGGSVAKKRAKAVIGEHRVPLLSDEYAKVLGKTAADILWEHNALQKSHKLVPNTNWCLVCKREHSAQKFCVFINPTDVIKSCFSGGSETMATREGKQVIKQFNKLILNITANEEETAFMELQNSLWDEGRLQHLMREKGTGRIFEQMQLESGVKLKYAYVFKEDCDSFVQRILVDHPRYKSSVNNLKNLKELLCTFADTNFPFLKVNKDLYGFRNAVLNIRTMQITPAKDYSGTEICRKYIDADLYPEAESPALDRVLDYQMDEQTKDFVLMAIGRTFFRTNELDKWQFMLYLYGESGTGKSRIIDLLRYLHCKAETISRGYQTSFGLHKIANADIWLIDDTPRKMADVFPQESLQSCISGGLMEIGQKHKDPYSAPFTTPMVFAGNYFMDYFDKGQIQRRIAIAEFPSVVPKAHQLPGLTDALENEAPQILYKCLQLYHQYVKKFDGQMMWTFAPEAMLQVSSEGREANDPLFRFLSDETQVCFTQGSATPLSEVKSAFERWLGKPVRSKLEHGTFMQVNENWRIARKNICKKCKTLFTRQPPCCSESDLRDRSRAPEEIENLRLKI